MSVRLKLIIIIVFVALVPLTVSALTTLGIHQGAFEAKVTELHRRTAENAATRLQAQMEAVTRGLTVMVTQTISWGELTEAELNAALWLVYRQANEVAAVMLLDGEHALVAGPAFVDPSHAKEEPEHLSLRVEVVKQLRERAPVVEEPGAELVLGEAFVATDLEAPLVPAALAVEGANGERWTVLIGLSVESLCAAVGEVEQFAILVADGEHRLVCPRADQPLLAALPQPLSQLVEGEGVGTYTAAGGVELLAASARLPQGWHVVAQQPTEVAYAASRRIRAQTIFWIVVGLVVALAAGLFLSRSISRPIQRLVEGVRELARGNIQHRLRMEDPDEFGRLGRAFDQMGEEIEARDAEIRQWNEELQERVASRTLELERAHQRLLHSEKVAAMGTFSSGVASEVNDPLTGVLGIAQLLLGRARKDPSRARDAELLEKAESEALRIRSVIRRVQNLGRDQSEAQFAPVRVNALADATLGLLAAEIERKHIEVVRAYSEESPSVRGHFMQLQQALLQVLANAVDAVSEEPQIVVSTLLAESARVQIVVADNGCGILPADLPSVMEPFFTTKVAAEGAGLGLPIAQRIIEEHHGTISVTSTHGEGTVVAIALPAVEPPGDGRGG